MTLCDACIPSNTRRLSARVKGTTVDKESWQAELSCLPFSADIWTRITRSFKIHNVVFKAISSARCYSTHLHKQEEAGVIEMYTATMSTMFPGNLAISSTYFKDSRLTKAVIYGCNSRQMERVEKLLRESPEVKDNPLLMVGVFAELQRDVLDELVLSTLISCDENIGIFSLSDDNKTKRTREHMNAIRDCHNKAKMVEEEVRETKTQLQGMIKYIREFSGNSTDATPRTTAEVESPTVGAAGQPLPTAPVGGGQGGSPLPWPISDYSSRFERRFQELDIEFEGMIARCRTSLEQLIYTRELFVAELSLDETKRAGQQATVSTAIAVAALIYLPTTAVATVFATPVFDFSNYWYDLHWNPPANSSSSSSSDDSSDKPVLSGYFWIYLALSLGLTFVTVVWWLLMLNASKREIKALQLLRDLPHEILNSLPPPLVIFKRLVSLLGSVLLEIIRLARAVVRWCIRSDDGDDGLV
ncbi:hypothetical protein B0T17DRAFT_538680 [Bombardia bombarda]|uniref:Uncharacterized protein n=1 Tax=Bombardia bombarda TaxID=252184 RepID=A0AA39WHU2_9PEZI|nr:hypothetical protein B0T17DRAFT_538680 [Bombardia bombarda]